MAGGVAFKLLYELGRDYQTNQFAKIFVGIVDVNEPEIEVPLLNVLQVTCAIDIGYLASLKGADAQRYLLDQLYSRLRRIAELYFLDQFRLSAAYKRAVQLDEDFEFDTKFVSCNKLLKLSAKLVLRVTDQAFRIELIVFKKPYEKVCQIGIREIDGAPDGLDLFVKCIKWLPDGALEVEFHDLEPMIVNLKCVA
jgi:hypothetical protein